MKTDSVTLSIESEYDADASSSETEFDLNYKSAIIQQKVIEHVKKNGIDLEKIAKLWHEPVIRKLYHLEVYGIFCDFDSSEIDFDSESEISDDQGFKKSDAFCHSTPRTEKGRYLQKALMYMYLVLLCL